jgi:hypothetical protein
MLEEKRNKRKKKDKYIGIYLKKYTVFQRESGDSPAASSASKYCT